MHDEFSDALQTVVEARRDVRHFPFRGGVSRDVVMHRDVRGGITGVHGKVSLVPIREVVAKEEVHRFGL